MLPFLSILVLGFGLGMRHATDPDHVVAVTAIVSREKALRAAAPVGIVWGIGHTATLLVVGGAIVLFGLVIPPRLGLAMELSAALMLVLLGGLSLAGTARRGGDGGHAAAPAAWARLDERLARSRAYRVVRPLLVGVVHGLAGSAAAAILVLGTVRDPRWAIGYLAVFGAGTIAGMLLITTALAMPFAYAAGRFERVHRGLAFAAGVASVVFGLFLVYRVGFVDGLFTDQPRWTPQ